MRRNRQLPRAAGAGLTQSDHAVEGLLYALKVERGRSENTIGSYGRDLRRFVARLADQGIHEPAKERNAS